MRRMNLPNGDINAGLRHLKRADARLAAIIRKIGPFRPAMTRDPFVALVSSIVHQQLSMKAAATIGRRLRDLCPRRTYTPDALSSLSDQQIRSAGISRQKLAYLRDLTAHFLDNRLSARRLRRASDDEAIELATQVKGIGRWTAEMLLIFCLGRLDVWPVDDLGLRKAAQRLRGAKKPLSIPRMQRLAEPWRPYRSIATWYLWRSLDGPLPPALTHD